jgi:hypothetical protein
MDIERLDLTLIMVLIKELEIIALIKEMKNSKHIQKLNLKEAFLEITKT